MNLVELDQALRKLRLSGMADVLDTRLLQAQTEQMAPIDLLAALVSDELQRREDRLLARRHKQARFRDPDRALDGFDFDFNKKINRALVFELATARFIAQREDVLLIGQPGTGKSHLAQAIGRAAIQQGYRVLYRETHTFLEEFAEATLAETRKEYLAELARAHLLIIDDLGMRKLPHTAAEDLLELIMRRYERASTMLTSNRPVDEWGKLLGDTAAVTALLDRLLHHAHVLKCGPRSWRTRVRTTLVESNRRRVTGGESVAHPALSHRAAVRTPWARFLHPFSGSRRSAGVRRRPQRSASYPGVAQRSGGFARGRASTPVRRRRHQLARRTSHPARRRHPQGVRRQPHPQGRRHPAGPRQRRTHRTPTQTRPARPVRHDVARPCCHRPRRIRPAAAGRVKWSTGTSALTRDRPAADRRAG